MAPKVEQPVEDAAPNGEPALDEEALLNDPDYIKRSEAVAVTEWYANERITFEQRALGALEKYKRTGVFSSVFPPQKGKKGKKGKDGKEKAKRSISAYNLFIRYEIETLKAKNAIPANSKITETIKGLGATWSQMSDKEKAVKAKALFERHQKENPGVVIPEAVLAAAKVRPRASPPCGQAAGGVWSPAGSAGPSRLSRSNPPPPVKAVKATGPSLHPTSSPLKRSRLLPLANSSTNRAT